MLLRTKARVYISLIRSSTAFLQEMSQPPIDDAAVAAADKEMEERANRAKELLSSRYKGLKAQQVCLFCIGWLVRADGL